MSDLISLTKNIQRQVGVTVDGIFGPVTAAAVLRDLTRDANQIRPEPVDVDWDGIDARSRGMIETLDPKARPMFVSFLRLAKATAATLGCDYVFISGNRTCAEQNALYAQGRTKPGKIVTNAQCGESNHNFAIAADAGVFRGGLYLDEKDPATAAKVHKACSEHAAACGLEWGGSWTGFKDLPHYEVKTGLTLAQKRKLLTEKGSVL